jgi:hypothetical protein
MFQGGRKPGDGRLALSRGGGQANASVESFPHERGVLATQPEKSAVKAPCAEWIRPQLAQDSRMG